jgi:hypothetical protein
MPTINLRQTTKLKPEQYIAALTDFGPGRSKVFGNSADAYLKVRHNCPTPLHGQHVRRCLPFGLGQKCEGKSGMSKFSRDALSDWT